jgi:hypothetical protein
MAVDTKRIMTVAKKNGLTIASCVVALAAVAVPFVVADGWVAETESALDSRVAVARSVQEIGKKSRTLPQLDPRVEEKKPLEMFPSKSVIDAGEAAKKHLESQAETMLQEALKLNVRRPLLDDVFTATPQQYRGAAFRFRDAYQQYMPAGLTQMIKGGVPLTAEEIARTVAAEKDRIQRERAVRSGGQIINQEEVQALLLKADTEIPQLLRNSVALNNQVYLSTDTWVVDPNLTAGVTVPTPDVVWFAQLGIWIQQEVARIVVGANGTSPNVLSSPVKHLVKVNFVSYGTQSLAGPYILPAAAASADGMGTPSVPVTGSDPASAITLSKGAFLTGRQATGLFDAVHFQMVVRVAESEAAKFLASIPQGRLVNVLNVELSSVDSATESAAGYIYGNEPVVQLVVECEMLMLRRWTETLMPARVKQLVGIEAAPVATPTP